jgi:hypothetical protein
MAFDKLREDLANAAVPEDSRQAQALAFEFLIRLTDVLDIEHRAPDQWEVDHVLQALGAIQVKWYRLAFACIYKATAAPSQRSEQNRAASEVTKSMLVDAISLARGNDRYQ